MRTVWDRKEWPWLERGRSFAVIEDEEVRRMVTGDLEGFPSAGFYALGKQPDR
jgi:hypothetical protein